MNHLTRRRLFGGVLIGSVAVIATVPARAQLQAEVYVPVAPPPPRTEVIPVLPVERVEIERWQPGYWRWNRYEHGWTEGHDVAPPTSARRMDFGSLGTAPARLGLRRRPLELIA